MGLLTHIVNGNARGKALTKMELALLLDYGWMKGKQKSKDGGDGSSEATDAEDSPNQE